MSAGAMRFPSRGRWLLWLIVLLVLGPFLVIFPTALWLGWSMNPVHDQFGSDQLDHSSRRHYRHQLHRDHFRTH